MSFTLYLEPLPPPSKSLPDHLKHVLRERYNFPVNVVFNASDLDFIEGLVCAGVDGAEELRAAVVNNGSVRVQERE